MDAVLPNIVELRERLRRNRRDAEAQHCLGRALAARGEYRRSYVCHRAAANNQPDNAAFLYDAGNAAAAVGRVDEAARLLDCSLVIDPRRADVWRKRGDLCLEDCDEADKALSCYLRAIELAPADPENHKAAARCLLNGQSPASESIARLRKMMPAGIDLTMAQRGVALACADTGDYEVAVPILNDLVREFPEDTTSMRVLAELYTGMHDFTAAQSWYERALAGEPDRFAAVGYVLHWSRLGDFERARRFYRSDMQGPAFESLLLPVKRRWQGQSLKGKTLRLIVGDIYFGDALQFARFARLAKESGAARVILEAPKRLRSLLRTMDDVDGVIAPHDPVPPTDYEAQAFWTLFILPTAFTDMVGAVPYLEVPTDLKAEWRDRIPRGPALNIGIVWRGSPYRIRDRFGSRSMRLEDLRPLTTLPNVTLFSLQCGEGRNELLNANPPFPAIDLAPDFPNTAAAIEALDLVVTVDTSIVHLAGALGKRALVMLPYDACFRWMVDREDTPWYPSIRLFRQSKPGEWSDVVTAVRRALQG